MSQLYSLRTLAAEHAGSLIKSLDTHAASDNTVQVFHKIFRNELEEDFRFIHAELSKTIKDLTMVQMMSRSNNNKDAEGIQAKVMHVCMSVVLCYALLCLLYYVIQHYTILTMMYYTMLCFTTIVISTMI